MERSQRSLNNSNETTAQRLKFGVPQVLRLYNIKKEIGKGYYGCVYLAEKKKRHFAIKSLTSAKNNEDIENEVKHLRTLSGRKNIITYVEHFQYGNNYAIVMEYFRSEDFRNTYRRFTPTDVQVFMYNLLLALSEVHSAGLTHGDVKPSNLLFNRRRKRYALIDFGMTQPIGVPLRDMGTVGYIAPESVLRYEKSTSTADVWSAGVIFMSMLSGVYPFFHADGPEALKEFCVVFGTAELKRLSIKLQKTRFLEAAIYNFEERKPLDLRKICKLFRDYDTFKTLNIQDKCHLCKQFNVLCICHNSHYENVSVLDYDADAFPDSVYDLLSSMLKLDPLERITSKEALNHKFFKEQLISHMPHCESMMRRFKNGFVKAMDARFHSSIRGGSKRR